MRRSVVIESFGGPDKLKLREEERPPLGAGQVRVRIEAIGVNRADILLRTGAYHGAALPARPGLEGAGVVVEAAEGVRYAPGDRVVVFADRSGLYTTETVCDAGAVCPIPEGVTFEQAAALPINWLTAWVCIHHLIRVARGESLVVLAAASGVGTAAVQIGREAGAAVIGCAGSREKVALAQRLGAAHGVCYTEEDPVAAVLRHTSDRGADGVLDAIGGEAFAQALRMLGPFGRVACIANVTLEDSVINTRDFYPKNASIHGLQLGRLLASGRRDLAPDLAAILDGVEQGVYRPIIEAVLPLENAAEAHRRLESRRIHGKLLLTPDPARAREGDAA